MKKEKGFQEWFKTKKAQSLAQLGMVIFIAIFLNILGNAFSVKMDLTEEGRFTLTDNTQNMLEELDDVVMARVLFEGKFPAGMKRLQKAVRETLESFRTKSGFIEYEFEDPYKGGNDEVNARLEEFRKDGIGPVNLRFVDVDGTKEVFGFPYVVFYYKGRMLPVDFLENVPGLHPDKNLENSIRRLEYKFANAIQKLQSMDKKNILFTTGHGELDEPQLVDLRRTLQPFYNTALVNLDSIYKLPAENVAALVVAKPTQAFPEKHKFVIDQYVMNGGKVLWLIDQLNVSLDSMTYQNKYVPLDYQLNLDDMLFRYGARINPNLVLDLQCSRIPQIIDAQGTTELFRWYYHPVVTATADHPIVSNLDQVNLLFPSSIDTVRTKTDVKKTVLLTSSQHSRLQFTPVRLDFEILRYPPVPEKFNKPFQPLAVLMEGEFPSLYENRVTEGMLGGLEELGETFKPKSVPTKMLVVADGDIAKNLVNRNQGTIRPLGYNKFERQVFANKDFLVNAIEYLMGDEGFIDARGKTIKTRLLNVVKARNERSKWQLINIVIPLIFVGIIGFYYQWRRKKKFAN